MELQEELKGRVAAAVAYPAFLAVGGVILTLVLVVFFVPRFDELFARLERQGTGLPVPTIILLAVSDVLMRYGVLVMAALIGLFAILKRVMATQQGRRMGGMPGS